MCDLDVVGVTVRERHKLYFERVVADDAAVAPCDYDSRRLYYGAYRCSDRA